ncbi:MAG TPA: RNA polymerase sigma factor [Streptosporangiaceae bacterium]|nr:RNA polymerase sigma factor [Streptosporangiaceae bacterium]
MELNLRARVRAGQPEAFSELFDDCARLVYLHALRTTGSWSVAEEIVSLTFLEAWRLRGTVRLDDDGPLRPWVLGIAVNVTRNVARAARRHQAAVSRLPRGPDVPDFADDVAGRLDDEARLVAAREALAQLRRGEREVVALCVWDGLGYAEAAQALGVPVGTVRSRLSRARRKLRAAAGEPAAKGTKAGAEGTETGTVKVTETAGGTCPEPSGNSAPVCEQVLGSCETAARPMRGGTR